MIQTASTALADPAAAPKAPPGPAGRLRVALIGCGAIAESLHLPVLAGHEQIEMVALIDPDVKRVGKLARGYRVATVLPDVSKLPAGSFDAAIIASPPFHHAPCTIDLLRRGIHVLVEKPMSISLAEAEAMVRASEEANRVLAVGFFRRVFPSVRLLKSMLESGWLGAPRRFSVEGGGMYSSPAATLSHMKRQLSGGGVLIDFGSHMLDLLFELFDEPAEVLDYKDNCLGGVEADCTFGLRFRHRGQPIDGTVDLARTRYLKNRIRVECDRGTLEFDMLDRFRVRVVPSDLNLPDPLTGAPRGVRLEGGWQDEDESEAWYETFRKQIDDWIDAIRTGNESRFSGRSALGTSRLIDECYSRPSGGMAEPWVTGGAAAAPAVFPSATSRPKRVLLTGASGFIGCRVAELLRLREGCQVRAVVNNPGNASRLSRLDVELVQASLDAGSDPSRLVEGCDAVIHCAIGTEYGDRKRIFSVTVGGTRRLAEAALKAGVKRFVHVSTMSVYGNDGDLADRIDETTPPRPAAGSEYGESKLQAEQIVTQLAGRGLPAVVFRPARVFGPFGRTFIMRPIQAFAGRRFRWLSSPDVPCDMVYVDNVGEALLRAVAAPAEAVSGQVFNISDGLEVTWRDFYQQFASALGLDLDAPIVPPVPDRRPSAWAGLFLWPVWWARGVGKVFASSELKSLGRRVLETEGVGTVPRWALKQFPFLERTARWVVNADGSPPSYRRQQAGGGDVVEMGSGGALLSIDKVRRVLGYEPVVSREKALELTLSWIKHARLI